MCRRDRAAVGTGTTSLATHDLPYADSARDVIETMVREAREFGHDAVGPSHLLLGVLHAKGNIAQLVLEEYGVDFARARSPRSHEREAP